MSHRKRFRSSAGLATLVALALIAATACGDDDDSSDDTSAGTGVAATASAGSTAATEASAGTATTDADEGTTATTEEATATTEGGDATADVEIDPDGEIVYSYTAGVSSLDPHHPIAGNDVMYMRPLYDRLITVTRNDDGGPDLAPQLATSWEVSDDGLTIDMELRDDVVFQDGATFDADTVVANFERAMGPDSTVKSDFAHVGNVEAVDPTHVKITLAEPDPALLWAFAIGTSGMMISPDALDSDIATQPAGSGPYKLVSAVKDSEVVYERWDDHWDPDAGLLKGLTIVTAPDLNTRYNGTRAGDYDMGLMYGSAAAESESLTSEGYTWQKALSPVSYAVLMNNDIPPLDDVRVRRAINMAIDREALASTVLEGLSPPLTQVFAPGVVGHDPDLDTDPYDPDAARALIEEAGATGATLTMISHQTAPSDQVALVVQQSLSEIGLNVEIAPFAPAEALVTFRQGGHAGDAGGPLIGRPEPSQTMANDILGVGNPGTPDPVLAEMADKARVMPVGSDEREQAYREISAYMVENPVHVPLAQFSTVYLCRPGIVGCEGLLDVALTDFRGIGVEAS